VRWVDLAWVYTALGQRDPARRAMEMALRLGPINRFVARAHARFSVHLNDFDRARAFLNSDQVSLDDPWMLSAEIAVATLQGQSSRHVKRARKVVESGRLHASHVSELACALASLAISAGKPKEARRLLRLALEAPTDNTLAHLEWIAD